MLVIGILLVASGAFLSLNQKEMSLNFDFNGDFELIPVGSEENFNMFLAKASSSSHYGRSYGVNDLAVTKSSMESRISLDGSVRYSETNVQVLGVDEADIVKTNGKLIFYSTQTPIWISSNWQTNTYLIDALPGETSKIIGNISKGGNLYLMDDTLLIIDYDKITSYNISNPNSPELKWSRELDGSYVDSRLIDGNLYLIVQEYSFNGPIIWNNIRLDYKDVYIPRIPSIMRPNFESTYIISSINAENGSIKDTVALVGSYSTTVYVSGENIYFAYSLNYDENKLMLRFISENGNRYFPKDITNKLNRIESNEDFGDEAKYVQITEILEKYLKTISSEERNNLMNKIEADYESFLKENLEDLEGTGIAKIELDTFKVTSGKVPGTLLNSFSMDEYNGNLRVATTIGNSWRFRDFQTNNIYVLDKDMKITGKLTGLEEGERIYSARFMGDTAYLVTFREIDPFFVIDLKDPKNPKVLGELKIPGYSTYLHPIGNNKIIGIGKDEQNRLKVSLFDVKDVSSPKEISKYSLNEYWSEALYNHHAFLWDSEKEVLVLPAGNHAFVLEVTENGIKMLKDEVHKDYGVLRAIYINDYLYTFSNYEIHVIDQKTWKTVNTINLPKYDYPYYPRPYEPIYQESVIDSEVVEKKVKLGENITITLEENPSTGYSWSYEVEDWSNINILTDTYVQNDNKEIVGSGGIHTWTFETLEKGIVTIKFDYYRPFEGIDSSISKKTYVINIE